MENEFSAFKNAISTKNADQVLMGLDLGTKTIGVAFSDIRLKIATARVTLHRTKFTQDVQELVALIDSQKVVGIVLGLPLNMDGTEGPRAQSTRAFARNFSKLCPIPIHFQDERLSSYAAEQAMIEADLSRKKRSKKIDAVAAGIILQGLLDRLATE